MDRGGVSGVGVSGGDVRWRGVSGGDVRWRGVSVEGVCDGGV